MECVKTVREFALKNENDLKRFYIHKTHITDPDMVRDTIQEFYVKLIQSRSLETYDPSKGSFKTYIMNLFSWLFPVLANRNLRMKYTFVSQVAERDNGVWGGEYTDVFNVVASSKAGPYVENAVDSTYSAAHVHVNDEQESLRTLREFIEYVKSTQSPKTAERIISYISLDRQGCTGRDIVKILGGSVKTIKLVKNKVAETYQQWKGYKMSPGKKSRKLTRQEIAEEIKVVQGQIARYNAGDITLPAGFAYREAVMRLKYLRTRQTQIKRRKTGSVRDRDHSA